MPIDYHEELQKKLRELEALRQENADLKEQLRLKQIDNDRLTGDLDVAKEQLSKTA